MKTIAKRLTDGQDLLLEINKLLNQHNVQAGVILSGVGALEQSNIRVPVIDGRVIYIHPQDVEINSLHGTVSKNGCHLHISVSDVQGKMSGGHIKQGCIVRISCEVVIGVIEDAIFTREPDEETGYDELKIASK